MPHLSHSRGPVNDSMTTIGSLFSGAGGLDLAVEHVLGGRTVWQVEVDEAARRVLGRHWPGADRSVTDVRQARGMRGVDVVCGGFPCQDLSVAGKGAGLSGARSGLFFDLARVVREIQPSIVVMENVPGLWRYREAIEAELAGYGCRWVRWSATTAGAPHLRRRVLIVAVRGGPSLPDLDLTVSAREWAQRQTDRGVEVPERLWPTATASDSRGSGARNGPGSRAHPGTSLVDAVVHGHSGARTHEHTWATPRASRLSPDWVECLMGWPVGWTLPEGPGMLDEAQGMLHDPRWPRGRPPTEWEGPWPGHPWEPARTESGPPVRGRPARLRQTGNGVVPQALVMALHAALSPPAQPDLWSPDKLGQIGLWRPR